MDSLVFAALMLAAAAHAGWNAAIKRGLDPLVTTVLIAVGAAVDRARQHGLAGRTAGPLRLDRASLPCGRRDDAVAARRRRSRPPRPPRGRLCVVHRADGVRLYGDRRYRCARGRQ